VGDSFGRRVSARRLASTLRAHKPVGATLCLEDGAANARRLGGGGEGRHGSGRHPEAVATHGRAIAGLNEELPLPQDDGRERGPGSAMEAMEELFQHEF
jgi:hypothetical protein